MNDSQNSTTNATILTYSLFGFIAGIIATLLFVLLLSMGHWGPMRWRMQDYPNRMMNPSSTEQVNP